MPSRNRRGHEKNTPFMYKDEGFESMVCLPILKWEKYKLLNLDSHILTLYTYISNYIYPLYSAIFNNHYYFFL